MTPRPTQYEAGQTEPGKIYFSTDCDGAVKLLEADGTFINFFFWEDTREYEIGCKRQLERMDYPTDWAE